MSNPRASAPRTTPLTPIFLDPPSGRALAQHLTMRLARDRTLTPTVAERRAVVRAILTVGGADDRLLAFGIADTHVHLLSASSAQRVLELARRIKIAMQRRLSFGGVSFEPTRVREVEDVHHFGNVLRYVVGQPSRHARDLDPAFEGSSLLELLGLRVVDDGRISAAVRLVAPRLEPSSLTPMLGVELTAGLSLDFEWLADAAAAAFALGSLRGRDAITVRARRAAVHAADGLAMGEIAALLEIGLSSVKDARRMPARRADVEAVRGQLRLRAALRRRER